MIVNTLCINYLLNFLYEKLISSWIYNNNNNNNRIYTYNKNDKAEFGKKMDIR